jgi:putative FmdB family regulatory protein
MPMYDYLCERCGPFTEMRPMSECEAPCDCPRCGGEGRRAWLSAPRLAVMSAQERTGHAINERSTHAPRRSSGHSAGCSCCGERTMRRSGRGREAARSFPGGRPWMISH